MSSQNIDGVLLHGYFKKLKTMKKKYFVLFENSGKSAARLEYFDNEKKFKSNGNPKRSIALSSCININRGLDTKHDFVITLSTKDDGFGIVMDSEDDMNRWLQSMLKLQTGSNTFAGSMKPYYEQVWQVTIQRKGLAEKNGILGSYHVCLSSKSITLVRIGLDRTNFGEPRVPVIEFFLTSIRRCGDSKCLFYMEVGRHSIIGAGELWMETKDSFIAQNMHIMILNVMSTNADDPHGPMRTRSSSATESSKPMNILPRRQTHSGDKTIPSLPLNDLNRDRCDSLPHSKIRTSSEISFMKSDIFVFPSVKGTSSLSTMSNKKYSNDCHSSPVNNDELYSTISCSENDGLAINTNETDTTKDVAPTDATLLFPTRTPGEVIPEENNEFWYAKNNKQKIVNSLMMDTINIHNEGLADSSFDCSLKTDSNNLCIKNRSQYIDMESALIENMGKDNASTSQYKKTLNDANCVSYSISRKSSFKDEEDGYVRMSPQSLNDVKNKKSIENRLFKSVTTPCNEPKATLDMNFSELTLKTLSLRMFADEDRLQSLNQLPPRAYSVGSRMEHQSQKNHLQVLGNFEHNNRRARAFSVGSKSKVPRYDHQRNTCMPTAENLIEVNVCKSKSSINNFEPTLESTASGMKSLSVPLLIHKCLNSVDCMGDLMEIDFSKKKTCNESSSNSSISSFLINPSLSSRCHSNILSCLPIDNSLKRKQNEHNSELTQNGNSSSYLEMRPVIRLQISGHYDQPVTSDVSRNLKQQMKIEDSGQIKTAEGYLEMSWNTSIGNSISMFPRSSISSLIDIKKNINVVKISSLMNNRILNTKKRVSKFSILQEPNKNAKPSQTFECKKSETNHLKSLTEHFNIELGKEKTNNSNFSEEIKNVLIFSVAAHDVGNVCFDFSMADYDCYDYLKFSVGIDREIRFNRKEKKNIYTKKYSKDDNCQIKAEYKLCDSSYCFLNKKYFNNFTSWNPDNFPKDKRDKPQVPKCSSSSPSSQSLHNLRLNKPSRQKRLGCELLICSDNSLETKKYANNEDSFSTENRPDLAKDNCLQSVSVSTSTSTPKLKSSSYKPEDRCDNRNQELFNHHSQNHNVSKNQRKTKNPPKRKNRYELSSEITCISSENVTASQSSPNVELDLHYATLDLPVSSNKASKNMTSKNPSIIFHVAENSTEINPNRNPKSNTSEDSAFTYALIEFNQYEKQKK